MFNRKRGKNIQARKVWNPEETTTSLISHAYLRVSSREDRYFNSGSSRKKTGEKNFLEDLKPNPIGMLLLVMKLEKTSRV